MSLRTPALGVIFRHAALSALTLSFLAQACRGPDEQQAGTREATSAAHASASATPRQAVVASASASPAPPADFTSLGVTVTNTYRERRFTWRQLEEVNWQALPDGLPPLPAETPLEAKDCPSGMVAVRGGYLLDPAGHDDDGVLRLQNRFCSSWRTRDRSIFFGRCDAFRREDWLAATRELPRKPVSFCIDRYEFPNVYGHFPVVAVTFSEARRYCEKAGKRLCNESEWTFACEGEAGMPFPYGYERDREACRIDILAPGPLADTFKPRTTKRTAKGLDLGWQGLRSGESPRCKSPFGVFDMTGNVDEWTQSVRRYGNKMILKGGHWGPARQRCRPQTRGHGKAYNRHDSGFRCCKDVE